MSAVIGWHIDNPPPAGTPSRYQSKPAFSSEVLNGPKVRLPPDRKFFLFEGPLSGVRDLGASVPWEPGGECTFERQTPSLWWPDDRAWCAGNEIDASFTCIGGNKALIDELLQHPDLEVLELDPTLDVSPYRHLYNNRS
jgi:hypothetical protein